ncbi:MAG: segregation and condensation protein A [Bacteroidota bacterium]
MQNYRVKLTEFEGPMDLLLFFIKRDELDIYDIPISRITKEFLEYLHLMATLDLEVAGDFIVMAATLMQIKVKMLLPRIEGSEEEEDPRAELVRRLIEYKRFKEASIGMSSMEDEQRKVYFRKFFHADPKLQPVEEEEDILKDVTLFNLISAFKKALDLMPKKVIHEVQLLNVSVDEQMSFTLDYLRVHKETTLLRLVSHMTEKIRIIVTVMALLEMTKNKIISLSPTVGEDDITIRSTTPEFSLPTVAA